MSEHFQRPAEPTPAHQVRMALAGRSHLRRDLDQIMEIVGPYLAELADLRSAIAELKTDAISVPAWAVNYVFESPAGDAAKMQLRCTNGDEPSLVTHPYHLTLSRLLAAVNGHQSDYHLKRH